MSEQRILYLSRADVEAVGVTMAEIIDTLEIAFHEHGLGHVEMPPKPGVHSRPDAFIHAMPAYIPALHAIGVKWVSAYPANQAAWAALHHRPADPQRRRDRPAAGRDGLHLDHRDAHRRGDRGRCEVPGATGFRDRGHPGLRRAGSHQSGGATEPSSRSIVWWHTTASRRARHVTPRRCGDASASMSRWPANRARRCPVVTWSSPQGSSKRSRTRRSSPGGWTPARLPRWSITTPTGLARR